MFMDARPNYVVRTRLTYTRSFGQPPRQSHSPTYPFTRKTDPSNPSNCWETLQSSSPPSHIPSSQPINSLWWDRVRLHIQVSEETQVADGSAFLRCEWSHLYRRILRHLLLTWDTKPLWGRSYVGTPLLIQENLSNHTQQPCVCPITCTRLSP